MYRPIDVAANIQYLPNHNIWVHTTTGRARS